MADAGRMGDDTPEGQMLAEVGRVLCSRAPRIELERTWTGTPCVRLYERGLTKGGNPKWTIVGPLLFGDDGATTHADVLRHLAGVIEQATEAARLKEQLMQDIGAALADEHG